MLKQPREFVFIILKPAALKQYTFNCLLSFSSQLLSAHPGIHSRTLPYH